VLRHKFRSVAFFLFLISEKAWELDVGRCIFELTPAEPEAAQLGHEIYVESLTVLKEIEKRLGDAYFKLLLKAFQLEGYSKFLHFHLPTKTKKSFRVIEETTSPTAERC
jgi:hypothetical protein